MSRNRKPPKLKLGARLDTAAAQKLRDTLLRKRDSSLCLDLGDVRWIGTACAELLISASNTWTANAHELTFINCTAEFEEGMQTLGLGNWLDSIRTNAT
jgi:chemotaxis protein CheX